VEGETLAVRLRRGPLPEPEVRSLTRQVAEGLVHAHAQGVIHRDLKPSNLVLEEEGRVRVVDFGIARLTDATGLTTPGTAVGTAAYLAPEQLQGDGSIGPPADVYTLGLVVLECLQGRRPFEGDAVETALARLQEAPAIEDDLPEPWPTLLRRMTAIEPETRPTAAELVELLDQPPPPPAAAPAAPEEATIALTGVVDLGETTGVLHPEAVAAPAPTPEISAPAEPPRPRPTPPDRLPWQLTPRGRRRLLVGALAAVALVLAILLAVTLTSGDDGGAEDRPARGGADVPADVADALEDLREAIRP
ncbi:MAG TPA: serine/threonine-protein kinase, partial [Acidimicrobiales bacterium]|nr:serine/threonine-protein kinase [Acidimicrobiales bacterium]